MLWGMRTSQYKIYLAVCQRHPTQSTEYIWFYDGREGIIELDTRGRTYWQYNSLRFIEILC